MTCLVSGPFALPSSHSEFDMSIVKMKNWSLFKSPQIIFPKYQYFFNSTHRPFSAASLDSSELKEFMEYVESLKNYEKSGVPKNAGTDSGDGFDLGRMRHLLQRLGNPQSKFKAFHVAGTKGKGSTATFLSSILRAEGYSVGCYTSPHIRTIRERITLAKSGEPVSAKELNSHFQKIKKDLDIAVELEKGHLSHFEVLTAFAFSLFAEAKVQFAVIEAGLGGARDATNVITSSDLAVAIITNIGEEHLAALGGSLESIALAKSGIIKYGRPLVLGGTFLPHIERMIIDRAMSLCSPVISTSDPGNRSMIKGLSRESQMPRQLCDVVLQIKRDICVFVELFDVKLRLLGSHQLQNAATATCAALCLRDQGEKGSKADFIEELEAVQYHTSEKESKYGWALSDASIRTGLEGAYLLGRGQFLTSKEAEVLGMPGATVLLDGAHTKDSARALANVIKTTFPEARLVFVVAMANDKDHLGFATELISVGCLEAVVFTEVNIAGDKSRTASASLLKDSWMEASREMGIDFLYWGTTKYEDQCTPSTQKRGRRPIFFAEGSFEDSMSFGHRILGAKSCGIIIFTGSLHIVSAVLGHLQG